MAERAKSISCDDLTKTGVKVAEYLKSERLEGFADARIAYFPDHGIFGGEIVLDSIARLPAGQIMEVADTIAEKVLSEMVRVRPAVSIKDRILIFGGDLAPDVIIGFGR
jgi:hypothetical protein